MQRPVDFFNHHSASCKTHNQFLKDLIMRSSFKQTFISCFNKIHFVLVFLGKAYITFVLLSAMAIAVFITILSYLPSVLLKSKTPGHAL
jgi:hypothetical protein